MKKVITFGTFDTLHPGHEHYLTKARDLGDYLITVIARDYNVYLIKGRFPYHGENKRLENLNKLGIADLVVLGDKHNPYKVILDHKPDIIALGYDQNSFNSGNLEEFLKKNNLDVEIVRIQSFQPEKYKSSLLRKN